MSEYTPTTDEIREYIETGGEPRPWVELDEAEKAREKARVAAFDRWLAAHDAEVRADEAAQWAQAVIDSGKQGERIGAARAGVVAEEPEWEYGVRLHPDVEFAPNENRATYTPPTTPHPSLELAQDMAKLNPRYRATYHRRRKAGPWVPVKQEGVSHEGD